MESPKNPQEPALPSQDESRRTNVLLEKILSEFRTFGEAQSLLRARVDKIEPDLHEVKENVTILKAAAQSHTNAIQAMRDAIRANTDAIQVMHADLKGINQRLTVVETKLAS
jgi:hypothetical protein